MVRCKIKNITPLRSIIHGETSVRVTGTNDNVQLCTVPKPKFIKHVLVLVHVLKIVKGLADVVSENVNNCVTVLYAHVML